MNAGTGFPVTIEICWVVSALQLASLFAAISRGPIAAVIYVAIKSPPDALPAMLCLPSAISSPAIQRTNGLYTGGPRRVLENPGQPAVTAVIRLVLRYRLPRVNVIAGPLVGAGKLTSRKVRQREWSRCLHPHNHSPRCNLVADAGIVTASLKCAHHFRRERFARCTAASVRTAIATRMTIFHRGLTAISQQFDKRGRSGPLQQHCREHCAVVPVQTSGKQ